MQDTTGGCRRTDADGRGGSVGMGTEQPWPNLGTRAPTRESATRRAHVRREHEDDWNQDRQPLVD